MTAHTLTMSSAKGNIVRGKVVFKILKVLSLFIARFYVYS